MKISVQTGGPSERFGVDAAYRIIKEAGFDAVDANIDHLLSGADIRHQRIPEVLLHGSAAEIAELVRPWKDAAKKYGLDNYQAHAPFPSYMFYEENKEYNDKTLEMLKTIIRASDAIDCRNLIIHPFFLDYHHQITPEEEWDLNIERYTRLIPTAKEYGVTVCLENMFTVYRGKVYAACCSNIDTACRYVDALNEIAGEKVFGFCLDTGHLLLAGLDIRDAIVQLGDRITAFHVHDNNGANDQHLAPYMGVLDWKRFVDGAREIGFNRTLSFETFNIWNIMDDETAPVMMRYIADIGRIFARRIEGKE